MKQWVIVIVVILVIVGIGLYLWSQKGNPVPETSLEEKTSSVTQEEDTSSPAIDKTNKQDSTGFQPPAFPE